MTISTSLVRDAELLEMACARSLCSSGAAGMRPGRAGYLEPAPDCLLIRSREDVLYVNRVLGAGLSAPITGLSLDIIHRLYRDSSSKRYLLQLPPTSNTSEAQALIAQRGGQQVSNWVKLLKRPEPQLHMDDHIEVRVASPADYDTIAALLLQSFGWPDTLLPFCREGLGGRGWTHYVALIDGVIAGTGSLFRNQDHAALGIAATSLHYRHRGVQSALIRVREQQACDEGCTSLFVETIEPSDSTIAPSYRNMIRHGFREIYRRPNFLFTCN
jgi:N-acetylglutamate synthase-like GNAT family acetyltransferase